MMSLCQYLCLCEAKDLANCWTDMVLLSRCILVCTGNSVNYLEGGCRYFSYGIPFQAFKSSAKSKIEVRLFPSVP